MNLYKGISKGQRSKRGIVPAVVLALILALLTGCSSKPEGYQKNAKLDTSKPLRLVIAGNWTSCRGMDLVAQKFHETYPNCTVEYEYLQNYTDTLPKRALSQDDRVDLFLTGNIQKDSDRTAYALDLLSYAQELPLTDAFAGMVDNYKYKDDNGVTHLYAVPLGGEMRGLYVNTTLLKSVGLQIPKNRGELLNACEKLRAAGYIAMQDNPGTFGQRLLFPYIAHLVSGTDDAANARALTAACDEGAADILRDPLEFLYNLTVENYYNYKYVETVDKRFLDLSSEGLARSFLNIMGSDGSYEKADDLGAVAFMTGANSIGPTIDKVKENYHSKIEYEFILAPVSQTGGYAYMSPYSGIAVNSHSSNVDWAIEFMRFFFTMENNKLFASAANVIPNTTDALEFISKEYGISVNAIGQPESVTFDGYNFYNLVQPVLLDTAKANNPKYMQEDGSMYPFEYYFGLLKDAFAQQRAAMKE